VKAVRVTALLAAILTYGLIVLGAVVRSTNSGVSCPDWPTCYDHWLLTPEQFTAIPNTGYTYLQVMLEWTHRLVAGVLLGPLVLLLAVVAFARRRRRPAVARAAFVLILLLLSQAALGRLTVLDQNSPWSVALHLGNALLVLTTILYMFVRSASDPLPRARALGVLSVLAWLSALGAMLAAAITAKSGAALACSTWPLCDGAVVPDLADPAIRIHVAHRALAAATGVLVLLLVPAAWRTDYRGQALLAFLLVCCQIGLGALVILKQDPISIALAHQALGVLTFAVVTGLMWRSWKPVGPRVAPTIGETHGLALRGA
jgi:heme A synthase